MSLGPADPREPPDPDACLPITDVITQCNHTMPIRASNVSILVNRMISFLIAGVRVWRLQASASASENRQAPANASKRRQASQAPARAPASKRGESVHLFP